MVTIQSNLAKFMILLDMVYPPNNFMQNMLINASIHRTFLIKLFGYEQLKTDDIRETIRNGKGVSLMGIYLNPRNNGFKEAIQSEIYVDKTELIVHTNKLINTKQKYICVSRPRRFGKSMAAEMLVAYYGKNCDSKELFQQYKIADSKDYKKHLNQHNVIALNMQKVLSRVNTIEEMLEYIQKKVTADIKKVYKQVDYDSETIMSETLEFIYSETGDKFIFIIDEWDCVLREHNYTNEDDKKYLDFLRDLLKDQDYVSMAYMTGILPIKKYGTHSALNMFSEYSMIDSGDFAPYIGFTEQEVRQLCNQYHMPFENVKEWYDGYVFDHDLHIYNPKSVVDSMNRNKLSSYWTNTETYEALEKYIVLNYDGLKDAIIGMLAGERVKINQNLFQNDMTTFKKKDDVLTLLVHLGYLAYDSEKHQVFIPNTEVRAEFVNAIEGCNWQEVIQAIEHSEELLQATWDEDAQKVAQMLGEVHMDNTSILSYNDENSLSCVISLAYYSARNEYLRIRELPAGKGFADIVYIPKQYSDKPAMLIELKYDKSAEGAIAQIKEKRYVDALKDYQGNLLLVGINYDKNTKEHSCVIEKYIV